MTNLIVNGTRLPKEILTKISYININSIFIRRFSNKIVEKIESVNCYYEILGVKQDASQLEIEDAYMNLKQIFDKSNESTYTERKCLKKLEASYKILSNIDQRSIYDLKLKSGNVPTIEEMNKDLKFITSDSAYNRIILYLTAKKPVERPLYDNPHVRRQKYMDFCLKVYIFMIICYNIIYIKSVFPEKVKTFQDWLKFPKWYFTRKKQISQLYKDYIRIYHNNMKPDMASYIINFPFI